MMVLGERIEEQENGNIERADFCVGISVVNCCKLVL